MRVITEVPASPNRYMFSLVQSTPHADEYLMTQYMEMVLQTSPYGDQPATVGPGPLPASASNPPGGQPETYAAVSQREGEVGPLRSLWVMYMHKYTMPPAHAAIVRRGLLTPERILQGTMRLGIFIDLANAAAEHAGVPWSLNLHFAQDGSGLTVNFVGGDDMSRTGSSLPSHSDLDHNGDIIDVLDSD